MTNLPNLLAYQMLNTDTYQGLSNYGDGYIVV